MGRDAAIEINEILESYHESSSTSDNRADEAEKDALAQLDAVAIKIDPDQDHAHETLLQAARSQVRSRGT